MFYHQRLQHNFEKAAEIIKVIFCIRSRLSTQWLPISSCFMEKPLVHYIEVWLKPTHNLLFQILVTKSDIIDIGFSHTHYRSFFSQLHFFIYIFPIFIFFSSFFFVKYRRGSFFLEHNKAEATYFAVSSFFLNFFVIFYFFFFFNLFHHP